MRFENGFKGVSKLFTSEILSLISSVCLVIAGIAGLGSVAVMTEETAGVALVTLGGAGALVLASSILLIIAYILKLVGLSQAGKDEDSFRKAFIISIFILILAFVGSILNAVFGANSVADDIVNLVQRIGNVVIIFLVINGVQNFAVRLHNENMLAKGTGITWLIIIPYILAAVANLISGMFGGNNTATNTIAVVLVLVGGILGVIGSIVYLVYLGQAKKMLREG